MEEATALLPPGFILLLIAGGRLYLCLCIRGSGALGRKEERRPDEGAAPATTAMWPAVLHGARPAGRRAATRRFGLNVMPEPAEAK